MYGSVSRCLFDRSRSDIFPEQCLDPPASDNLEAVFRIQIH